LRTTSNRSDDRLDARTGASRFLALGCVSLIAVGTPALAQESTSTAAGEPKVLGSVTVTDTAVTEGSYKTDKASSPKYTAPLLDTPRSVSVIPSQVLADTATASLTDALRLVPGITLGAGEGGSPQGDRPYIRGTDAQNSMYLDGVRDIGAASREVFAVDQIEVVKGSDSTMGGRGNVGGAINMVSKLPVEGRFADLSAATGTSQYKRLTADINQPLGHNIGLRIAAMYHDQNVAGRDAIWQSRWGVAPSVKFGLTGPSSLTLAYYHLDTNELPDSGIPYQYTINNAPAGVTETGPVKVRRGTFYGLVDRDFRRTHANTGTATAQHEFGNGLTLRNTFRYGVTDQSYVLTQPDDSKGNVANGYVWRRANTRYSETTGLINQTDLFGSFAIGHIKNTFTVTAEISTEKVKVGAFQSNPSTGTAISTGSGYTGSFPTGGLCGTASIATYNCTTVGAPNPYDPWVSYASDGSSTVSPIGRSLPQTWTRARTMTKAISVLDTIDITKSLLLNVGVRYDHYITRTSAGLAASATDESGRTWVSRRDDIVSYQAGLTWKPAPNGSIYFSTSSAATPPGSYLANGQETNALGTDQNAADALKVERTKSYEVGTKWNVFDEGLSLTLAAFRTDTSNARSIDANGLVSFIGERLIKGIEFSFSGNITPRWNVFGGYTYMDSTIVDGGYTVTSGLTAPSVNTGKRFPNTPEHSFTAATTYKVTDRITLGGNAQYMGKVYGGYSDLRSVSNGAVVISKTLAREVPAYWRFDANAQLQVTPRFALQVNVNNVFNKRYFDRAFTTHFVNQAAGRTAIITAHVKL
jgi:catecholate siderophore receptor